MNFHTTDSNSISADSFGERLCTMRGLRGWSAKDLARRVDMPTKVIVHYEDGFVSPSLDSLHRLAIALEVSTDYLLGIVAAPDLAIGDVVYSTFEQLAEGDRELVRHLVNILVENRQLRR